MTFLTFIFYGTFLNTYFPAATFVLLLHQ